MQCLFHNKRTAGEVVLEGDEGEEQEGGDIDRDSLAPEDASSTPQENDVHGYESQMPAPMPATKTIAITIKARNRSHDV